MQGQIKGRKFHHKTSTFSVKKNKRGKKIDNSAEIRDFSSRRANLILAAIYKVYACNSKRIAKLFLNV